MCQTDTYTFLDILLFFSIRFSDEKNSTKDYIPIFEYNLLPADFMQNEFQAFFEVGVKLDLVVTMQRQRQSSVNKINSYIRYHLCMM